MFGRTLTGLALTAALGLSACTMEEPDSYSEQGKGTKVAKTKGDTKIPRWKQHMNEVSMGMSMAEVKALLGKPSDTDSSESEFMGDTTTMDTWTYGDPIEDDSIWMLSFTDGKLDGKT